MTQKLYRSKSDAMVGGVAAGIADYFAVDATLVRLAWLVAILFGGTGLVVYFIAWIIIPANPEGTPTATFEKTERWRGTVVDTAKDVERNFRSSHAQGDDTESAPPTESAVDTGSKQKAGHADGVELRRKQFFGWALVVLGAIVLINNVMPWFSFARFWPVLLILIGLIFLVREVRN